MDKGLWKTFRHVFFYLIPIRKDVVLSNLEICFPDKPKEWKEDILKKAYKNVFIVLLEFLYFPRINKINADKNITVVGNKYMDAAITKGKGVILLSGHISNWELSAYAYPLLRRRALNIIAKEQASKRLNKRVNKYRKLSGNKIIQVGASLRQAYKILKTNKILCFLIDQSAHPDYSVYVDFFGKKVATFAGAAKMALKQGSPVIMGYMIRNEKSRYQIKFEEINYDDIKDDTEANVLELTQRMQTKLENVIREYPEQWFWFHRRFKHLKEDV
jgi:KDO2-lipid IV(A) lauroyltransferase